MIKRLIDKITSSEEDQKIVLLDPAALGGAPEPDLRIIGMFCDVSEEKVSDIYLQSWKQGLKGITVYRDGSRHKQVLHMTSENAKKTFEVAPSDYISKYIAARVKNSYIKSQVDNAITVTEDTPSLAQNIVEEEKEETLCPTCKNKLIFVEGCNICIDCGYSGCTSG